MPIREGLPPNYQNGFARGPGDSAYPSLWRALEGLWFAPVGKQNGGRDFSRYNNDAVFNGGLSAPTWGSGRSGEAATAFTSTTSGNAEVASSSRYDNAEGTISFWFNLTAAPASPGAIVVARHDAAGSSNGFDIGIDTTPAISYENKRAGSITASSAALTLTVGQWYHVAYRWSQANGGANEFFLNGIRQTTMDTTNNAAWTFASQVIRFADSIDTFWSIQPMVMHTACWHSRKLNDAEIRVMGVDSASPLSLQRRSAFGVLNTQANDGGQPANTATVFLLTA